MFGTAGSVPGRVQVRFLQFCSFYKISTFGHVWVNLKMDPSEVITLGVVL
jgi:hypothetical protein